MGLTDIDAEYNTTAANLGLQEGTTLKGIETTYGAYDPTTGKWSGGTQEAETNFREGQITEAEPDTYKQNDNRANRGGVLRSGTNAGRRESIAKRFASQRAGNQLGLSNARSQGMQAKREAEANYATGLTSAGSKRDREKNVYTEEHPPSQAAPPGFTIPAQAASPYPAGPGGVVPYESGGNGQGAVRVGMPPLVQWSRDPNVQARQRKEISEGKLRAS